MSALEIETETKSQETACINILLLPHPSCWAVILATSAYACTWHFVALALHTFLHQLSLTLVKPQQSL